MGRNITNLLSSTRRLARSLTQPPAFITDEDERNHIRTTKAILQFSILANAITAVLFLHPITVALLLLMSILYVAIHTRYYHYVPILLVLISTLVIISASYIFQSPYILLYVVPSLLMGVLICNIREITLHSIVGAIGMILVIVNIDSSRYSEIIGIPEMLVWTFVGVGFTLFVAIIREEYFRHFREQRRRYHALLNGIPDMIFRVDRTGLQIDGFIPDWLPFDKKLSINRPLSEILPEDIAREYTQKIVESLDKNDVVVYEYELENNMGMRIYETRIVPAAHDEVIAIVRDITDARTNERYLQNLMETSPDFVFVYDVQTRKHTFFNRPMFMGYTIEDFADISLVDRTHPDYQQAIRAQLNAERIDTTDKIFNEELYYRKKYGDWAWIRRRSRVIVRNPDGTPKEIMVTLTDITESKEREATERENQQKTLSLIEHSTDGIVLMDEDGLIAEWSKGMEAITGLLKKDVIAKPALDIQLQVSALASQEQAVVREKVSGRIKKFLEDGTAFWESLPREREIKHVNGELRLIQPVIFPIETERGFMAGSIMRDVTSLRKTEKALKASEARRKVLMDVNPDLMFWLNRDGYYIDAYIPSDWHTQIPKNEIIGRNLCDLFPEEMCTSVLNLIRKALDTGKVQYFNYQLEEVIGLRDYEARLVPAGNDEIVSIARDVTEQKQAQRALAEESRLLQTLIDAIPEAIYVKDRQHRLLRANIAMQGIHGEDLIGKTDHDFDHLPQSLKEKYRADEEVVLNQGNTVTDEEPIIDFKGNLLWVNVAKVPLYDESGEIVGLAGISTDVTTQRLMKDKLAASEARLLTLLGSLPVILTTINQERQIQSVYSAKDSQLFGHAIDSVIEKPIESLLNEGDKEKAVERLQQVFLTSKISRFSAQIEQAGEIRWYENHIALLDSQQATIVTVDVTEQRIAEQKALQVDIEKQRTRLLTEFIQSASHEFRTPLSIIQSSAYLLSKSTNEEKREKRLEMIEQQIAAIIHLIDSMVLMSSLDSKYKLKQSSVEITPIIRELINPLSFSDEHNNFHIELKEDLPPIQGDGEYIRKALHCVIDNAIQYSPEDSTITIRAYEDSNNIVIEVQDEGIGMDEKVMARIFERFYRADQTQAIRGFGLGLPIAQKIINRHNGQILVQSESGVGSIFRIKLPTQD